MVTGHEDVAVSGVTGRSDNVPPGPVVRPGGDRYR